MDNTMPLINIPLYPVTHSQLTIPYLQVDAGSSTQYIQSYLVTTNDLFFTHSKYKYKWNLTLGMQ